MKLKESELDFPCKKNHNRFKMPVKYAGEIKKQDAQTETKIRVNQEETG